MKLVIELDMNVVTNLDALNDIPLRSIIYNAERDLMAIQSRFPIYRKSDNEQIGTYILLPD